MRRLLLAERAGLERIDAGRKCVARHLQRSPAADCILARLAERRARHDAVRR